MEERDYQICSNCVMNTTDSLIQFDDQGVCDHCNNYYNNILPNWNPDETGIKELEGIVQKIKKDGEKKKYDCIIGLSGGVDSSYVAYYAKVKLGLKPLIFSVDTGWNTDVANNNIRRIVDGLGLEMHVETVDWEEMGDLQLAYFKAQVAYQDIPQDHVIFAALYNYAAKNGFKYVLTGANYSTECVREPNEWVHVNDLRQIKDIHNIFGTLPLKELPLCGMFKYRLYYRYFKGMEIIQPLNLIPYIKKDVIKELNDKFGWEPYKNKHFESIFTRFYEGYWLPTKFGFDKRRAHFSSLILTKQLKRGEALQVLEHPPYALEDAMKDMEYISTRLGLTKEEFIEIMNQKNKTYKDYKSDLTIINAAIKLAKLVGKEKRNFR